MELGIYYDLAAKDYHADPALSKGMIDKFAITPSHYKAAMEAEEKPATPAMILGALSPVSIFCS